VHERAVQEPREDALPDHRVVVADAVGQLRRRVVRRDDRRQLARVPLLDHARQLLAGPVGRPLGAHVVEREHAHTVDAHVVGRLPRVAVGVRLPELREQLAPVDEHRVDAVRLDQLAHEAPREPRLPAADAAVQDQVRAVARPVRREPLGARRPPRDAPGRVGRVRAERPVAHPRVASGAVEREVKPARGVPLGLLRLVGLRHAGQSIGTSTLIIGSVSIAPPGPPHRAHGTSRRLIS
jgi:hypothetical protein